MISSIHVLLIDDHPLYRAALKPIIQQLAHSVQIIEAASMAEAFKIIDQNINFDLVLLDLTLPDASGLKTLIPICQLLKDIPIVIISAIEDRKLIAHAINGCASGYIPKSASKSEIKNALTLVLSGSVYIPSVVLDVSSANPQQEEVQPVSLTKRQNEVILLLAQGLANKQIASHLNIAETTVRVHVSDILHLLNAKNRTEAVIIAQQNGLLDSNF